MLESKDLWQTAYLMAEGHWLNRIKIQMPPQGERKRDFLFVVDGFGVEDLARQFRDGDATCNVKKLRRHMNYLKDLMFGGDHRE